MKRVLTRFMMPLQPIPATSCARYAWLTNISHLTGILQHSSKSLSMHKQFTSNNGHQHYNAVTSFVLTALDIIRNGSDGKLNMGPWGE